MFLRVHRDLIEDLRTELRGRQEEWVDEVVTRVTGEVNQGILNKVLEEIDPDRFWEDLTDKDYRLTMIEEELAKIKQQEKDALCCSQEESAVLWLRER